MKKKPLVIVEWEDISGSMSWMSEKEVKKTEPIQCTTVGWQMKSTGKKLVLISTYSGENSYSDRNTIPKGCIKSIRRLE